MAALKRSMHLYDEAIGLYEKAILIRKTNSQDSKVAQILSSIGAVYEKRKMYDDALIKYEAALNLLIQISGEIHCDVAHSMTNMAVILKNQKKNDLAQLYYEKSLEIRKQLYGINHPDVAQSMNNLAALLYLEKKYDSARKLYEDSLNILIQLYGRDNLDVAQALNNLAALLFAEKRFSDANQLYEESLNIRTKYLGRNHLDVASSLCNLGILKRSTHEYQESVKYFRESLDIRLNLLRDESHSDVQVCRKHLAYVEQMSYTLNVGTNIIYHDKVSGKKFKGIITSKHSNGTYDIRYSITNNIDDMRSNATNIGRHRLTLSNSKDMKPINELPSEPSSPKRKLKENFSKNQVSLQTPTLPTQSSPISPPPLPPSHPISASSSSTSSSTQSYLSSKSTITQTSTTATTSLSNNSTFLEGNGITNVTITSAREKRHHQSMLPSPLLPASHNQKSDNSSDYSDDFSGGGVDSNLPTTSQSKAQFYIDEDPAHIHSATEISLEKEIEKPALHSKSSRNLLLPPLAEISHVSVQPKIIPRSLSRAQSRNQLSRQQSSAAAAAEAQVNPYKGNIGSAGFRMSNKSFQVKKMDSTIENPREESDDEDFFSETKQKKFDRSENASVISSLTEVSEKSSYSKQPNNSKIQTEAQYLLSNNHSINSNRPKKGTTAVTKVGKEFMTPSSTPLSTTSTIASARSSKATLRKENKLNSNK